MKITELIDQIEKTNPRVLKGIPENRAKALIRNVFKYMNDTLAETSEGLVIFAGLGRFRLRKVERELGGKKIIRTQIIFRRAEPGKGNKATGASTKVR